MQTRLRTHTCGALRPEHQGQEVVLTGWVDRRRDYGQLVFIDLRDRYGRTQVVAGGDGAEAGVAGALEQVHGLRHEDVIRVTGPVRLRDAEARNPKLATGDIEVHARAIEVLNRSKTPPFEVNATAKEGDEVALETRLRYRPLDLRRPAMQERLITRHRVIQALRRYFDGLDFVEVETPILTKATPEGARDYLVPSRVNQGAFYALPQSPQLFKQLLMVGGYDRYYQVARCFRDEDLRQDRQPEFTQLDLEMSFIDEEDVFATLEGAMRAVWREVLGKELRTPFPRLRYDDALARYGIDKPDLRFALEIQDVSAIAARTEAAFLRDPAQHQGGRGEPSGAARALVVPGAGERFSRKDLDALPELVKPKGANGVAWLKVEAQGELKGSVKKFFEGALGQELVTALGAMPGDLILIVADKNSDVVAAALGELRLHAARKLDLIDRSKDAFLWVTDFAFFEHDPDTQSYIACRHPFTQPRKDDVPLLDQDPLKVRARAYDLVLNGSELGSGSIRIHDPDLQRKVLAVLGYDAAEAERRFGFLIDSLGYGAPPHGGAAIGLDRFAGLVQGITNLREVVAFPKTAKATCLLTGAPSAVDPEQLRVVGVKVAASEAAGG